MYTLRNREPGLLPFNSIHHRYYRADSQVLSFFYITAAALYPHSVPLTPKPHASYKGKALQVHNFIWCEDWPLQSFSCNQSHCSFFVCFVFL